jgi:hypothetical protein
MAAAASRRSVFGTGLRRDNVMKMFGGPPRRWVSRGLAAALAVVACGAGTAWAFPKALPPSVPEIDGASMSSAVALLFGGLMLLNARRRRD